jgi:hypothetical protein
MPERPPRKNAPHPPSDPKRPLTFSYIVFYILFWPDTYRIVIGIAAGALLSSRVMPPDLAAPGKIVLFLMIAAIGYAVSAIPGRGIAARLRRIILG